MDKKKKVLKCDADELMMEQLEAISRASENGKLKQNAMVLKAMQEYIALRFEKPEVQKVWAAMKGQPLQLVPKTPKAEADS